MEDLNLERIFFDVISNGSTSFPLNYRLIKKGDDPDIVMPAQSTYYRSLGYDCELHHSPVSKILKHKS
jgi:hypothetical protein